MIKTRVTGQRRPSSVMLTEGRHDMRRMPFNNIYNVTPKPTERMQNMPDRAALNAIEINSLSRREQLEEFVASGHGTRRNAWRSFPQSVRG